MSQVTELKRTDRSPPLSQLIGRFKQDIGSVDHDFKNLIR